MKYIAVLAMLLGLTLPAEAQESSWKPTKNVEIVIGLAAGGQLDRIGRALQQGLQQGGIVDVPVTVVNKPGAGMMVGVNYLNTHPGDAHYIMVVAKSWLAALASRDQPGYQDITPIMKMISDSQVVAVNSQSSIKTIDDLLARLKEDISSISFAFNSRGSVEHIAAVHLAEAAGADPSKMKVVIFESGAAAATQLAGGHVDVYISSWGSAMPLVEAGKLRILGVGATERTPGEGYANYPTLQEQGVKVYSTNSYLLIGPKGITPEEVTFWHDAAAKALDSDAGRAAAKGQTWQLDYSTPGEAKSWLEANFSEMRKAQIAAGLAQ